LNRDTFAGQLSSLFFFIFHPEKYFSTDHGPVPNQAPHLCGSLAADNHCFRCTATAASSKKAAKQQQFKFE